MVLVSFFDIPNQKSVIWERPILSFKSPPPLVQFEPFCTWGGGDLNDKIGLSQITDFWLGILKNDTNTIWTSIINTYFTKETGVWLKNWAYHVHLKFKIEKGMAGSIFEPHPPNFQNQDNFWRWSNDVTMTFWNLYWFESYKKDLEVSYPVI